MKAMILAAGSGERMQPLTDKTPKPMLEVHGKPLIQYTVEHLKKGGFTDIIINTCYLADQIENFLQDGSVFDVSITYSKEESLLSTGGGLLHAMPLLSENLDTPFLVVNADIWSDFDFSKLMNVNLDGDLAKLVLVKNPDHNNDGDFCLDENNRVKEATGQLESFTFSGISVLHPLIVEKYKPDNQPKFPLRMLFREAIKIDKVSGQLHDGLWVDVGTPERFEALNKV